MIIHVISLSGGKDSLATLLIALERCPPREHSCDLLRHR